MINFRVLRATLAGVAVLAAVLAPTAASAARADEPATACKSGGFAGYVDPATGSAFADQGSCVSFVRHGGTLAPVVVQYNVWQIVYDYAIESCTIHGTFIGQPGTVYQVTLLAPDGQVIATEERTGLSDGSFTADFGTEPTGTPLTVVIGDQRFVTPVFDCQAPA